jgi:hypothetical protein
MKFSWFGRQASICNASVKRSHARGIDGLRPSRELAGSRRAVVSFRGEQAGGHTMLIQALQIGARAGTLGPLQATTTHLPSLKSRLGSRAGFTASKTVGRGGYGANWNNGAHSGMVTLPGHANSAPAR